MILVNSKRLMISILLITVFLSIFIGMFISIKGEASKQEPRFKYYKSVQIEQGTNLWNIASENISDQYKNIVSYIEEVKSINNLKSDAIKAGEHLMVPYYSDEYR